MLLGTHPIPARSPAEREGQKRKWGGRERETEEERRRRDGEFLGGQWGSVGGMIEGRRQRKSGEVRRWGFEDDGYSRRREERENGGITCYMNEAGRQIRARENNQQLTTATSGHINIRLWRLRTCLYDQGRRGEHGSRVNKHQRKVQWNDWLSKHKQFHLKTSKASVFL